MTSLPNELKVGKITVRLHKGNPAKGGENGGQKGNVKYNDKEREREKQREKEKERKRVKEREREKNNNKKNRSRSHSKSRKLQKKNSYYGNQNSSISKRERNERNERYRSSSNIHKQTTTHDHEHERSHKHERLRTHDYEHYKRKSPSHSHSHSHSKSKSPRKNSTSYHKYHQTHHYQEKKKDRYEDYSFHPTQKLLPPSNPHSQYSFPFYQSQSQPHYYDYLQPEPQSIRNISTILPKPEKEPSNTLMISSLGPDINKDILEDIFREKCIDFQTSMPEDIRLIEELKIAYIIFPSISVCMHVFESLNSKILINGNYYLLSYTPNIQQNLNKESITYVTHLTDSNMLTTSMETIVHEDWFCEYVL